MSSYSLIKRLIKRFLDPTWMSRSEREEHFLLHNLKENANPHKKYTTVGTFFVKSQTNYTKYIHSDLDLHWNILRAMGCYYCALDILPALLQNSLLQLWSKILIFHTKWLSLPTCLHLTEMTLKCAKTVTKMCPTATFPSPSHHTML